MLHSYVTDMAARVTPTIQIPTRLQSMAFSTRSRWCRTILAGADLVRIMVYWCGVVRIWHGAVRIDAVWCGFHTV